MGISLLEVAQQLNNNTQNVQLIYAFNGTGKTRLSREFKTLIDPREEEETKENGLKNRKILYYNAFTEDLFFWDNDLSDDQELKLKIHSNNFTKWVLEEQGQEDDIYKTFQNYNSKKLIPKFNSKYNEVIFTYRESDENIISNITRVVRNT